MSAHELDLSAPLPTGRVVIEASAGTGKTYSLTALVVRHIAERGITASEILLVTFTRAAAAELRDRTRQALVVAATAIDTQRVPPDQPWLACLVDDDPITRATRLDAVRQAIASFDDATITTIHGFCQQALRQLGLRSGTGLQATFGDTGDDLVDEVCRDLVVATLLDDPAALSWSAGGAVTPAKVLSDLKDAVATLLGNPGAVAVPQLGGEPVTVKKGDSIERLARWVGLVHEAVAQVGARRRARQELGFDDLITGLRDAVAHPVHGPDVVRALASRYRLVMVDEFQDTDQVQWDILRTVFAEQLITVGDPKQAIYRFRGADVHAYLAAVDGEQAVALGTNFRSDADLVEATNSLLVGLELGDPRIRVESVRAAPSAHRRALLPGAPLVIRRMPDDPQRHTTRGLSAPWAQQVVVADLVRTVVDLLERHTITSGSGEPRAVNPGDIAVLVPSHPDADHVARALQRSGVPVARTRTGSVLRTSAAQEWALLLAALERPSHPPSVRAAALGRFLHRSPAELDPMSPDADRRLAELQQRCAQWAYRMSTVTFLAWYDEVRADSGLVASLLAPADGERVLTDLDHIAEILALEVPGVGATAAAVRRVLDRLVAEAGEGGDPGPRMRRIDSDADAVQITTIHSSKGLQYPIVLVPFSYKVRQSDGTLVFNLPDGRRAVDIATKQDWHGADIHLSVKGREHLAKVEQQGDLLRLLYVALTRAQHRTVVWWAPVPSSAASALNRALFERDPEGEPLREQPTLGLGKRTAIVSSIPAVMPADDDEAERRLQQLAARSGGLIEVDVCAPAGGESPAWSPTAATATLPSLAVADAAGRVLRDPAWLRWSFTGITRTLDEALHGAPVGHHGHSSLPPVVGGVDEPTDHVPAPPPSGVPSDASVVVPWAELPGSAAFGTMVHSLLERLDPTSPTLPRDVHDAVWAQLRRDRLGLPADVVEAGIVSAMHTSLGPLLEGRRLVDIPVAHRLAELDFDMPLVGTRGRFAATAIGHVLLSTLPADDPQRDYARSLADGRFAVDLAGYLQGSIDAVLRVEVDGVERFVVVDYKTNRLHSPGDPSPIDAYHPHRLPAAMAGSDYPLQALLYSVALHRYLRWRLPNYEPSVHLGGIAYLFLRGMVGDATPHHQGQPFGVFSWRPPAATIVGLDRLLAEGSGR